ncbi:MAG: hypothetical protein HY666_02160, partial [Chloroflexi bacterium]|nr:hypothetical protein [Chloroflexota bacterium]
MRVGSPPRQETLGLFGIRIVTALFSLGSAASHLALAPEHFREWWGYGWFFVVVSAFQGIYAVGLMAPKGSLFKNQWYLLTGISLNLWVAGFYTVTRTVGIPLLGPHAGHVEGVGVIDVFSKTLELGTVASLGALLFWHQESRATLVNRLKW